MRIGLLFNRSRAYGRGFCEGVASYTEVLQTMKLTPVIFGTSCLGNLYKSMPMETKVAIAAAHT